MQLSQTLNLVVDGDEATVRCALCDHAFGPQGKNWKYNARLGEEKMNDLGVPYTTGDAVLLRSFSCPGCGVLLDTELAMDGDAFLQDIIFDG